VKTKELIKQLQEADPSGELEVNAAGEDILYVDRLPGYYDGCYEVIKRNDDGDTISIEVKTTGEKIIIKTEGIKDAIADNDDVKIIYDSDYAREHYEKRIEEIRKETKTRRGKL
jgi:hypothetical protein